jgi:hypothetical protein
MKARYALMPIVAAVTNSNNHAWALAVVIADDGLISPIHPHRIGRSHTKPTRHNNRRAPPGAANSDEEATRYQYQYR